MDLPWSILHRCLILYFYICNYVTVKLYRYLMSVQPGSKYDCASPGRWVVEVGRRTYFQHPVIYHTNRTGIEPRTFRLQRNID